jgi:hypothetical protein
MKTQQNIITYNPASRPLLSAQERADASALTEFRGGWRVNPFILVICVIWLTSDAPFRGGKASRIFLETFKGSIETLRVLLNSQRVLLDFQRVLLNSQRVLLNSQRVLLDSQRVLLDSQRVLLDFQRVLLDSQRVLLDFQRVLLDFQRKQSILSITI